MGDIGSMGGCQMDNGKPDEAESEGNHNCEPESKPESWEVRLGELLIGLAKVKVDLLGGSWMSQKLHGLKLTTATIKRVSERVAWNTVKITSVDLR